MLATVVALGVAGVAPLSAAVAAKPSTSDAAGVEALQRQLNALGCDAGPIDGKLGPDTVQAVRWFQTAAQITVDGLVGVLTSARLATAAAAGTPTCTSVPAPAPVTEPNGAPTCTQALVQAGAQVALLAGERLVKSGPYRCAGRFAYNAPTVASSGARRRQVIELMRWTGITWQVVNRSIYCESGQVPNAIYRATCLTGNTDPKKNPGTSDAATVQRIQRELNALGCNAGAIDGRLGAQTTTAIRWFQTAARVGVDGIVGSQTGPRLVQASIAGTPNCRSVPKPAPAPKPAGGPPCELEPIRAAAQAALDVGERIVLSGPFRCAGSWVYNAPTIANATGTQSQVNFLMRWNGTAWQVVDRGADCESGQVPAAVYQPACQV